ncbi:MAG: cytochrome c [Magnetospirillum sp.]|nr:cytochrome c [Magnetospirillum sp.]
MRFISKAAVAAVFAVTIAGIASQAVAQQKPDEALKMRQGLFQAVKMNFGPIGAFAQGKGALPADAAAKAENVAALARMLPMAFAKGTEALPGSNTKPEAFASADFAKGFGMMEEAATKLAAAAKAGDEAGIKAAVGDVGKTCKGCHDNFRKE